MNSLHVYSIQNISECIYLYIYWKIPKDLLFYSKLKRFSPYISRIYYMHKQFSLLEWLKKMQYGEQFFPKIKYSTKTDRFSRNSFHFMN